MRTLSGKEIELDIESDYKARLARILPLLAVPSWSPTRPNAAGKQVAQIKEKVEEKEGIPPVQQRLIYSGKQMYLSPLHGPVWRASSCCRQDELGS